MRFVVVRGVDRLVDVFSVCVLCSVLLFDDLIFATFSDDAVHLVNYFGCNLVLDNLHDGSNIPLLAGTDTLDSRILFSGNLNNNGNGFISGCGCGLLVNTVDVGCREK